MRVLEDGLDEIASSLTSSRRRTMTIFEDDVPKSVRPAILERIADLSARIESMKRSYGLTVPVFSNRQRLLARLSSLSIDLTEATSKYMVAFGTVHEGDRKPLDDRLSSMIALVEDIAKIVADGSLNS